MKGVSKFSTYLKKELKDKKFLEAFKKEGVYAELAIQIARLRESRGYTQKDLARILNTTQQTVSRLEDPGNNGLSIGTLLKLAHAFRKNLRIQFV
ncbi:MAG: helix-turn-helix transcriptional regulator [Candidatus Omnitrophica bacterium]|nr:helix-turn-helix transcriptional regulator [Candidatus Omnitrophota bacterium]